MSTDGSSQSSHSHTVSVGSSVPESDTILQTVQQQSNSHGYGVNGVGDPDLDANHEETLFRTLSTKEPRYVKGQDHNYANSPLYRLPEELLLETTSHLADGTIRDLRATCRHFARLLSGPRHQAETHQRGMFSIWPRAGNQSGEDARDDADYDDSCDNCRDFRASPAFEAMENEFLRTTQRCDDCNDEHPLIEFLQASEEDGKCFKRVGRVRLCEHMGYAYHNAAESMAVGEQGALTCQHHWGLVAQGGEAPRVTLSDEGGYTTVRFSAPVCVLDPSEPVTLEGLAEELSAFDPQKFGLAFCPHVRADDGQLLLPFGPDLCACFAGDGPLEHDAKHRARSQRPDMMVGNCCRCRGNETPELKGVFIPLEKTPGSCHQYPCSRCLTTYSWARKGRRVYLMVARRVPNLAGPWNPRWFLNLDPEDMGFRDERLRHWVWCDEKGCRTGQRWWKLSLMWDGVVAGDDAADVPEQPEDVAEEETVVQTAVTRIRRAEVSWRLALEIDGVVPQWLRVQGILADANDPSIGPYAHNVDDWVEVDQEW